jgi:hypothetical protein
VEASRGSALSLCLVLAGALALPLGLRAVNRLLPDEGVKPSYLPSVETPRPREPFDESAASDLREARPDVFIIGDSMAGTRIDPRHLSQRAGKSVAALLHPGSPVAYWYLELKNLIVDNGLTNVQAVIFFFRDDQLTTQVEVTPGVLDRVAREYEPDADRVLAAHRLGVLSGVHRAARSAYQFDRTRQWLEPRLTRAPVAVAAPPAERADFLDTVNAKIFPLERLRKMTAADLPAPPPALDFQSQVGRSFLPEILALAARANIRLAFVRVQRRPTAEGPPAQSEALVRYMKDLAAYLEEHGAYFHDDWGDPNEPLSMYADGDHLVREARIPYTDRFLARHAPFFR